MVIIAVGSMPYNVVREAGRPVEFPEDVGCERIRLTDQSTSAHQSGSNFPGIYNRRCT